MQIRGSIVVSISACHADDPGSIPGRGVFCNYGSHGKERRILPRAHALEALGVGYFLTYAKSDLSAHPAILHFEISTFARLRNRGQMQFGGFGRGLLLQASITILDLFANPAILHF